LGSFKKFGVTFFEYLPEGWAVGLPLQDWLVVGGQLFDLFHLDILKMDRVTQYFDIGPSLEIGETSYILGSHHPRALQGFVLVLVERGGGLCPLLYRQGINQTFLGF
jgi:hypothetical protein